MSERNIVDQIYFDFYTLIDNIIGTAFSFTIANWQNAFLIILTLAAIFVFYKALSDENFKYPSLIKSGLAILAAAVFLFNGQIVFEGLKFIFIDFFIESGNITINGILQASGMSSAEAFTFEPNSSKSPFGALWDFCMVVCQRLLSEGGITDLKPVLAAIGVFIVAIGVVVIQIVLMVTGFLMATVAILGFPIFSWMFLFPTLKPMFEKWLNFGLIGGILIYMIIAIFGVIMIFLSNSMGAELNYDVLNPNLDVVSSNDNPPNLRATASLVLFMAIAWKLIPKTENWASSISAISAHGLAEGASAIGRMTGQFLGLSAKEAGDAAVTTGKAVVDASKAAIEYGNNQIEKGAENYQSLRDQHLETQLQRDTVSDSQMIANEKNTTDSTFAVEDRSGRGAVPMTAINPVSNRHETVDRPDSSMTVEKNDQQTVSTSFESRDDNSEQVDVTNQISQEKASDESQQDHVREKVDQIAGRQEAKSVESQYERESEKQSGSVDGNSNEIPSNQREIERQDFQRIHEIEREAQLERKKLTQESSNLSATEIQKREQDVFEKEKYVDYLKSEYGESDRPESKEIDK